MQLDALAHADAHLTRIGALEDAAAAAHETLCAEALQALTTNPAATLATPGVGCPGRRSTAAQVWNDFMDSANTLQVLNILRMLDQGQGATAQARLLAQGLLAACAKDYADFYADEYAAECA